MKNDNDPADYRIQATTNSHNTHPISTMTFDENNCIFGDGTKSNVITINDQFPGPVLELQQGNFFKNLYYCSLQKTM